MCSTLPPNEELVLTSYLRARCQTHGDYSQVLVSNRLTTRNQLEVAPIEDYAIIVRGDGGPYLGLSSWVRRIGIRVFGPDGDDNHIRTSQLARLVTVWLQASPHQVREIAATRAISGPHRVAPTVGRPEMYLTAELVMLGESIKGD